MGLLRRVAQAELGGWALGRAVAPTLVLQLQVVNVVAQLLGILLQSNVWGGIGAGSRRERGPMGIGTSRMHKGHRSGVPAACLLGSAPHRKPAGNERNRCATPQGAAPPAGRAARAARALPGSRLRRAPAAPAAPAGAPQARAAARAAAPGAAPPPAPASPTPAAPAARPAAPRRGAATPPGPRPRHGAAALQRPAQRRRPSHAPGPAHAARMLSGWRQAAPAPARPWRWPPRRRQRPPPAAAAADGGLQPPAAAPTAAPAARPRAAVGP